ncbi:GntR family transcriptional regulator [Pelotomaculum terephthalicicum JT]|uniref:GntR family transcriptional regulator n=1 Tax=Pelotomaculum TaxID=191373 RepID=UPI0009C61B77|nr:MULTISPECIES: GntR family transcriptional regulator [Pelotomaculum]MCG9969022.1 GntR family transcriptional regulator [Pelotomaculum terephthalicicum JT]OPX91374.1 MAG: putative HTH-type transcriptional regulator YdfH [Pelotomaculum sp. PtaB.Bin117]OPY60591.1 MAG: putative HTH-type transcriptional regulator YdfH [Pelotomaculum sp. PtaU1.Bin065]
MGEPRLVPIILDNYKPLRELVFESLREAILLGRLKPGERLMEVQLAEEMGVSRTPVREAIRKLELDGFVVMVPRKGAYVAAITLKDIADVFEVRAALEGMAAGLAAERITEEELDQLERSLVQIRESQSGDNLNAVVEGDTAFHDIIYRASRNQQLEQIITHLREQIQRFRMTSLSQPGRTKFALDEHKKIVEAISDRDVEQARLLAREHIENAEQILLNAVRKEEESND